MEIRKANKNDVGPIAELIYSSGPEIYDFIYQTDKKSALDYINYEYKSGRGFCGFNNVTVAVKNDEVVATGSFYDGKVFDKLLLGTLKNMFLFYFPSNFLNVLNRSKHTISVMQKPKVNELYLSNFGVSETLRGQGIGSEIAKIKITDAKAKGYKKFILDVADTNPQAEALYKRLGLNVIKNRTFSGKREGFEVPGCRLMEIELKN